MTDYDELMRRNLAHVFSERDAARRLRVIHELYAENAILCEPDAAVTGHAAISEAVTTLLASLPPSFTFEAIGTAAGHHGLGKLHWQAGFPNGPVAVTGMDVVQIQDGLIKTIHVFLDSKAA